MNDLMAAGCIHALQEIGLSVPGDIAVVGFDNREIARYLQPPLTTVALPTAEIGVRSAKQILSLIQNPDVPPQREIIPCAIIERNSV
jgi:LacI family transcriptional regulator